MDPKEQPSMLPVPRLVVRVGVTGHRPHKLPPPEAQEELKAKIREVLARIKGIALKIFDDSHRSGPAVYSDAKPELRLISSLAEGADQLVAEEATTPEMGFNLQCPLPFFREEYAKDFKEQHSLSKFNRAIGQATAIFELDGTREREAEAYEAAGRVMLNQCDLLVAIWNGEEGLRGGTAQIVREALTINLPVIWIKSQPDHDTCLWQTNSAQGQPEQCANLEGLDQCLRNIFFLPQSNEIPAIHQFFREEHPTETLGFIFDMTCDFWYRPESLSEKSYEQRNQVSSFRKKVQDEWEAIWSGTDDQLKSIREQLTMHHLASFAHSDGLSTLYAGKYRSSFLANYVMGSLAILFAYLGSAFHDYKAGEWLLVIELALIVSIIAVTGRGKSMKWHERWMDYRVLAESVRPVPFLFALGQASPSFQVPAHLAEKDPRNSWFNWYFRVVVREAGLVNARTDSSYLLACRKALSVAVRGQLDYHRRNDKRYSIIHHRLHKTAEGLFLLAAFACFLHILPLVWDTIYKGVPLFEKSLTFFAIVFPAFGGALAAINNQAEFERIARRSAALEDHLTGLLQQLETLDPIPSSRDLGRIARSFHEIALAELVDWRFVFLGKHLSLPA